MFRTSQVAKLIGVHPNTVRLYEELGFITAPEREKNGYRIYTSLQIGQMKLARLALQGEILQNGLRKHVYKIIDASGKGHFDSAITLTEQYRQRIKAEIKCAEDAIEVVNGLLAGSLNKDRPLRMTRQQTADYLQVSIDTLRNWEMNGLLTVKRKENGYRVYDESDITRLKIIRALRCANYSLSAILRMLSALPKMEDADIKKSLNTPGDSEDIVSVCDRLLTSLYNTENDACHMLELLKDMQKTF